MDKSEAKLLLQACRPDGRDDDSPAFAQAFALMKGDPELKSWWESQRAFDRAVAARLREIPIPEHLRPLLLAGGRVEPTASRSPSPYWLAIAALVAIALIAGWHSWLLPATAQPTLLTASQYSEGSLHAVGEGPLLGMTSENRDILLAWLQQRHAPLGSLSKPLVTLPTVGCQEMTMKGHRVSLICFALADGKIAHLFTVEKSALTDPPSAVAPAFDQKGDWSTASWSDASKSYILATNAGPEELKRLL